MPRIQFSGKLRELAEEQARLRPNEHEDVHDALDRHQSELVVETADEADAAEYLLDRTEELNALTAGQEDAAKRVRTELYGARADIIFADA